MKYGNEAASFMRSLLLCIHMTKALGGLFTSTFDWNFEISSPISQCIETKGK